MAAATPTQTSSSWNPDGTSNMSQFYIILYVFLGFVGLLVVGFCVYHLTHKRRDQRPTSSRDEEKAADANQGVRVAVIQNPILLPQRVVYRDDILTNNLRSLGFLFWEWKE